jgi:hypothetical protein
MMPGGQAHASADDDRAIEPEHQQFGPLPRQHHQTAEHAVYKQVEDRNDPQR